MTELTVSRLRDVLHYDSETGDFTWRFDRWKRVKAGNLAGYQTAQGYKKITIDGKSYWSHRLAWLYVFGDWPTHDIDHIDRDRGNNRLSNLRVATRSENTQNTKLSTRNTSGYRGVSWNKCHKKWHASIAVNRSTVRLGYFDSPEEAHTAYLRAAVKLHTLNPLTSSAAPAVNGQK